MSQTSANSQTVNVPLSSPALQTRCLNCGAGPMASFYEVRNVPVHSCLLMPTRDDAVHYPRGDVQLGVCPSCGFISNLLFDASRHEYSPRYEETQGFSPTFNAFAKRLAQQLVDRYDIHRKDVLEIGCGKGEFLLLLCELGDNRGIGIDPGYVPKRLKRSSANRALFIQDFYSEKYAHLKADFVCCRHTLEHIAPTQHFVRLVRQSIGPRDSRIFFELPDVLRVLREGAFWDIYYEHCSYFTAGSLARLFRAESFDLIELALDYDGQYLVLTCEPADAPTAPRLAIENDLPSLLAAVDDARRTLQARRQQWGDTIRDLHSRGKKVVIWGSGSKGVAFLTTLGIADEIEYAVDINPYRHGKYMPGSGQLIVSPSFMKAYRPDCVIIMNPVYRAEIAEQLDELGLTPQLLAV